MNRFNFKEAGHAQKLCMALALIWMILIFSFSARNAEISTQDSYRVGMAVGSVVVPAFNELPSDQQIAFAEKIDFPVRKTAHATEYAILAVLLFGTIRPFRFRRQLAWFAATCYAAADELHQWFVPGRSCQLRDVMIDSLGAVGGIILASLIIYIWRCYVASSNRRLLHS